jgi:hypothetical protein
MWRISPRTLIRSPLFVTGALTVLLAAFGIILSVATVVSLHFASPQIPAQLRQAFVPSLKAEGASEQTIQNFIAGQVLSSNELSRLPEPQAQALLALQEASLSLVSATEQALTISRQHSLLGIGVCTIIFFLGLVLAGKAIKRVRLARAVPA